MITIDRCKQEVHDQTLVGKMAESAVLGGTVARKVRALTLKRTIISLHYRKEKRQAQVQKINSEILVVYTVVQK